MGLHVGQMTSQAGMRQCFDAVTVNPARLLGLEGYGLPLAAMPTLCCCMRATRQKPFACGPRAWAYGGAAKRVASQCAHGGIKPAWAAR